MTFTLVTAPKGPNICHRILSSASGARLYTKIHHPVPGCPGILIPAKLVIPSMVIGENLLNKIGNTHTHTKQKQRLVTAMDLFLSLTPLPSTDTHNYLMFQPKSMCGLQQHAILSWYSQVMKWPLYAGWVILSTRENEIYLELVSPT